MGGILPSPCTANTQRDLFVDSASDVRGNHYGDPLLQRCVCDPIALVYQCIGITLLRVYFAFFDCRGFAGREVICRGEGVIY